MFDMDQATTARKIEHIMELDEWLDFVTDDDGLGLLQVKSKVSAPTADEHLLAKFNEINNFVIANDREPEADMANVPEFMLNQRLNAIRKNNEQCAALAEFDLYGLLPTAVTVETSEVEPKEINSLDDIFSDDTLGLLDSDSDSIFKIKNVPTSINMPSKVAKRKRCENFDKFESRFKSCHADIKSGEKEQHKFTGEQQIQKGQFFVLHGVMCYVADMDERVKKNSKVNAKLHLIFENGTESNMLLRSLATELYKDETGRRILNKSDDALNKMLGIEEDDQASGYIYILQSLSTNPEISSIQNLYKIGYSTTSVEKRIANAQKEPTYLMAPVQHVSSYKCFNINAQKFENLLHTFFAKSCLDIEVVDMDGNVCRPREWFIAPIYVIESVVQLLINGEIVHYRYNAEKLEIEEIV